jgi:hypothetical protein
LKTQRILLALIVVMWLPIPFIGYFSHHDGLMVTTVNQLQNAIRDGGPWPFNQYGSFWAFVYAIPTWSVNGEYLLISMRLMTLVLYFITAFITYKIARLFGDRTFATAGVILLLGNQVFLYDLLPWPSAIAMPMITQVSYLLLKKATKVDVTPTKLNFEVSLLGILIPMVILTRIQIGTALFLVAIFVIKYFGSKKEITIFALSFFSSFGIFFAYLASNGWLIQSLQDQVLFGSSYLESNSNPIPIFTSIGTLIVIFFLASSKSIVGQLNSIGNKRKLKLQAAGVFLVLVASVALVLERRSMNISSMYLLVINRLWISLILGAIIYFGTVQLKKSFDAWRDYRFIDKDLQKMNVLALLSIAAQLQIFPLFDQMHSWWGSTPGVVILLLLFKEKFEESSKSTIWENKLIYITFIGTLLIFILPFTLKTLNLGKLTSSQYLGAVYLPANSEKDLADLQSMFEKNLISGTRVLNLCPDPDVFLKPNFVDSESRVFIFWPEFLKIDYLKESFADINPEAVVSCISERSETFGLKNLQELTNSGSRKVVLVDSIEGKSGHDWQIWKFDE